MSIQQSGYICEKGKTHGNLSELVRISFGDGGILHKISSVLFGAVPAHIDHLIILFGSVDRHWHIVISRYNLSKVSVLLFSSSYIRPTS